MARNTFEITEIYSYPAYTEVTKEKMISVNKQMNRINQKSREEAKRGTCYICNKACSSFCRSHSIPEFVLRNIAENSEVSEPRQADNLEPKKNTGLKAAGVFFNICKECDSKYFQDYEDENILKSEPSNEMLTAVALKNFLKMNYERSLEIIEERVYSALMLNPLIVSSEGNSPAEYNLKSISEELMYALTSLKSGKPDRYYLYYWKNLDYVVPYAAQYPIAMLQDLQGNVINDFYTGLSSYRLEYLHVAIFPLKESSVILIFSKDGEKRHRRFIRQLKRLDDMDQLSVINFLTFTGSDNVYINLNTYANLVNNPVFMEACRLTYSIRSNVPNPSNALAVAKQAHSFEKRYALPNLLAPQYALNKDIFDESIDNQE